MDERKKKHGLHFITHISDAMITTTTSTKHNSKYLKNNGNWATTNNFSSLLLYKNGKNASSFERLTESNHVIDYRKNPHFFNSGTQIINDSLLKPTNTIHSISNSKTTKTQRQFTCTYCPFSCTWFYDLKIHLRQKHKIPK